MNGNQPIVLAVDDEPGILRLIRLQLSATGFRVTTASDGEKALVLAEQQRPDIVLLDILMPQMSGIELMQKLRERSNVPVILLTGKGNDEDKVQGLKLGADDYLVKPFHPNELTARVRAVLRRALPASGVADNPIRAERVEVDLILRTVKRDGALVYLTRMEWLVLSQLASNANKVIPHSELLANVWGPEFVGDIQYLSVIIRRLRGKLEADPANPTVITTQLKIGYVFNTQPRGEGRRAAELEVGQTTTSRV